MNRKKIDDVIAEMREFIQACDTNELTSQYDPRQVLMYKGMRLRDVAEKWADELADDQERLPHFEHAVLDVVKATVGNIAAMREALESSRYCLTNKKTVSAYTVEDTLAKIDAALAAPPRNCDRHGGDYKKLHAEWFEWTGTPEGQNQDGTAKMVFGEWLLALAPEDRAEKGHV